MYILANENLLFDFLARRRERAIKCFFPCTQGQSLIQWWWDVVGFESHRLWQKVREGFGIWLVFGISAWRLLSDPKVFPELTKTT
jgi:hypothetical protein